MNSSAEALRTSYVLGYIYYTLGARGKAHPRLATYLQYFNREYSNLALKQGYPPTCEPACCWTPRHTDFQHQGRQSENTIVKENALKSRINQLPASQGQGRTLILEQAAAVGSRDRKTHMATSKRDSTDEQHIGRCTASHFSATPLAKRFCADMMT